MGKVSSDKVVKWKLYMKYVIAVIKSNEFEIGSFDNEEEAFESAFICSAGVVSSIIESNDIKVEYDCPTITIYSETEALPFTLEECKSKVKVAFIDENGRTYPEFSKVEVNSI